MKIYVLKEYGTKRLACISEDVQLIKETLCDKKYFDGEYDYPMLSIFENGGEIERVEGGEVLKRITKEINNLSI